jgi:hypothetical protein
MSRKDAAEELIRAQDNARELGKAGKLTSTDVTRVKEAQKAYDQASGKK